MSVILCITSCVVLALLPFIGRIIICLIVFALTEVLIVNIDLVSAKHTVNIVNSSTVVMVVLISFTEYRPLQDR